MEQTDLLVSPETQKPGFSATRLAAMSISLAKRTQRTTFGEGEHQRTHTVLTHPLLGEDIRPPYKARLPKRMILAGLAITE